MSDTQDDGPPLLRPIPRRPFNLNIREPTPPDDNNNYSASSEPPSPPRNARSNAPPALNLESLNSRLLRDLSIHRTPSELSVSHAGAGGGGNGSSSINRTQSILNLTGSTLMGIYTPNTYGPDRDDGGTPWGTGAETPARFGREAGSSDEDNEDADDDDDDGEETDAEKEMRRIRRSSQHAAAVMGRRRSSLLQQQRPPPQQQPLPRIAPPISFSPSSSSSPPLLAQRIMYGLAPRALLLSALGVLYGALVARVLDRFRPPAQGQTTMMSYDWKYMAFWGASGVLLGGLLPWFDGVWEGSFGGDDGPAANDVRRRRRRRRQWQSVGGDGVVAGGSSSTSLEKGQGLEQEEAVPAPDWSLAVRGIGAFAGIAFAIRKLSWDSTLQVSATLGLVNPVLWYLIDRSVPGLLMAGAVGIAGSAIFMVPLATSAPFVATFNPLAFLLDSNSGGGDWNAQQQQQQSFNESSSYSGSGSGSGNPSTFLADAGGWGAPGSSSRHALESAIWTLSVLFCCCVCFGNIGRWLALMSSGGGGGGNRPRSGSVVGGA